jgi:hypothetical protein
MLFNILTCRLLLITNWNQSQLINICPKRWNQSNLIVSHTKHKQRWKENLFIAIWTAKTSFALPLITKFYTTKFAWNCERLPLQYSNRNGDYTYWLLVYCLTLCCGICCEICYHICLGLNAVTFKREMSARFAVKIWKTARFSEMRTSYNRPPIYLGCGKETNLDNCFHCRTRMSVDKRYNESWNSRSCFAAKSRRLLCILINSRQLWGGSNSE